MVCDQCLRQTQTYYCNPPLGHAMLACTRRTSDLEITELPPLRPRLQQSSTSRLQRFPPSKSVVLNLRYTNTHMD